MMKTSEVFRQAKEYLGHGDTDLIDGESYICHAIEEAAWANAIRPPNRYYDKSYAPYRRAKKIIQERIHPHCSLEEWLVYNVEASRNTLYTIKGCEQMQAYRHRWLDALIKEFQAEEQ